MRTRVAVGAALATGLAAAWVRTARRDAEAVRADPAGAGLVPPVERLAAGSRMVRSSDGALIRVTVLGPDDAPTVVLAHGWTCAAEFWTEQLRALPGEFRVVAYDQRGHGGSEAPGDGELGPDQLADDLAAVLAATVEGRGPAVLAGHSMGAMAIVAWAGRYPDDVERLASAALLASTGIGDLVSEALLVRFPHGWKRARVLAGRVFLSWPAPLGRPSPLSHRLLRAAVLSPQAGPAQVRFCEEIVLQCRRQARAAWGRALSRLDLRHAVERLTVPTTVLVGTADRLTPPVLAERLAAALPRLERMVEVPGAGHMTPVEAPDVVTDEIRRLAADHVTGRISVQADPWRVA